MSRGAIRGAPTRVGRVLIVGAGQIGTAVGLGLRGGPGVDEVALCDLDLQAVAASLELGSGDRAVGTGDPVDADAVVLAMPVPEILRWIEDRAPGLPTGSLVLDTGSVKRPVVEAMRRSVPDAVHAVGGHPIAGTVRSGPDGAAPDLLRGAPFVLSPVREDPEGIRRARALVLATGGVPVEVDAAVHDSVLARTSHAPHLVAAAVALAAGRADPRLAGPGLAAVTRLAESDPAMVAAFLEANADEVRQALEEIRRGLDRAEAALDEGPDSLERLLAEARLARREVVS